LQFAHSFDVERPRAEVWDFVRDVPAVLACIPGVKSCTPSGDGRYRAVVTERVGPFKVEFHLDAEVSEPEPGRQLEAKGGGRDVLLGSTMQLRINVTLDEAPSGGTRVSVDTDLAVLGKLATLGFGIMQRKAQENMNQFAANMKQRLEEGAA
jgi:carbon monoxide dehydrogenase subunit G